MITAKSIEYSQLSIPNDKVAAKIELNTMTIISLFLIIYHPFPLLLIYIYIFILFQYINEYICQKKSLILFYN